MMSHPKAITSVVAVGERVEVVLPDGCWLSCHQDRAAWHEAALGLGAWPDGWAPQNKVSLEGLRAHDASYHTWALDFDAWAVQHHAAALQMVASNLWFDWHRGARVLAGSILRRAALTRRLKPRRIALFGCSDGGALLLTPRADVVAIGCDDREQRFLRHLARRLALNAPTFVTGHEPVNFDCAIVDLVDVDETLFNAASRVTEGGTIVASVHDVHRAAWLERACAMGLVLVDTLLDSQVYLLPNFMPVDKAGHVVVWQRGKHVARVGHPGVLMGHAVVEMSGLRIIGDNPLQDFFSRVHAVTAGAPHTLSRSTAAQLDSVVCTDAQGRCLAATLDRQLKTLTLTLQPYDSALEQACFFAASACFGAEHFRVRPDPLRYSAWESRT